MKIDAIDLKLRSKLEEKQLIKSFKKIIKQSSFVLSKQVTNFEKKISNYLKAKYCLGCNSGTDALMMALWAAEVKKGDEVITTPISFVATIAAIKHVGAKPILVDVGEDLNIDTNLIERKITKRTKAIMPVHWGGRICNMKKINKISKKYNLKIIEDSAQAIGGYCKSTKKFAGNLGDIGCFSAHPLKILNAVGDGGYIVTNNKRIYEKIKMYRNHGIDGNEVEIFGVNSRLDSIHAEILSFRLKSVKKIINKRAANIKFYKKFINTDQISFLKDDPNYINSNNLFHIFANNRDSLVKYLKKKGIDVKIYYPTPLHLLKSSKELGYKKGSLPKAEYYTKKIVSLPFHQYLKKKQITEVINAVNKFYK